MSHEQRKELAEILERLKLLKRDLTGRANKMCQPNEPVDFVVIGDLSALGVAIAALEAV